LILKKEATDEQLDETKYKNIVVLLCCHTQTDIEFMKHPRKWFFRVNVVKVKKENLNILILNKKTHIYRKSRYSSFISQNHYLSRNRFSLVSLYFLNF